MYNYHDVEKIKCSLEQIVRKAFFTQPLLTSHDQRAIFNLLELIQTYEDLLGSISEFGVSVINSEVAEGLSATEKFIVKVKRNVRLM